MKLTYRQCKAIINNLSRDELENFLTEFNRQPQFLTFMGKIEDLEELAAILQGGCASGAYMPAVTYYTVKKCLVEYHDSIEDEFHHTGLEFSFNPENQSFSHFATELCSAAVELWCQRFADIVETLDQEGVLYV